MVRRHRWSAAIDGPLGRLKLDCRGWRLASRTAAAGAVRGRGCRLGARWPDDAAAERRLHALKDADPVLDASRGEVVSAVVPQRLGRLGSSYRPANEHVQPAIACESNQPSHVRACCARRVRAAAVQANLLRPGWKCWHLSFGFVASLQGRLRLESCSGHGLSLIVPTRWRCFFCENFLASWQCVRKPPMHW